MSPPDTRPWWLVDESECRPIEEPNALFTLGIPLMTLDVQSFLEEHAIDPLPYFRSHLRGEWGLISAERAAANTRYLDGSGFLVSCYVIAGKRICLETDPCRDFTTMQFPEDLGYDPLRYR